MSNEDNGSMKKDGGYKPLNEGYKPSGTKGYKPTSGSSGGNLPQGGSGQSSSGKKEK